MTSAPDAPLSPLPAFLRRYGWLLIFLVALLLRWWGNGFGLPHIYTSDEAVTVNRAVRFGTFDFNPHWFNYGSLNMYFLFVNYGAFYAVMRGLGYIHSSEQFARLFISDPTGFYLIGRAWSGLWSALCVIWTYCLGRRWGGEALAWGAALLLAVNVTTVDNAHSILNDPLMVFLMLWAVAECDGIRRTGRTGAYLRAGLAIGLAASTKYIPVLLFVAVVIAHVQRVRTQRLSWLALPGWRPVMLAGLLAGCGFLIGTPYAVLDAPTFLDYMREWKARGATGVAYLPPDEPSAMARVWGEYLPDALGWLGYGLALAGALLAAFHRPAWLAPYAGYAAVLILFLSASKQITPRYPLPLYPLLALLMAYAVTELAAWFGRQGYRYAAMVTGCGVLLAALAAPAISCVENDVTLTLPDTRTLMKQYIERTIPAETKILMDPFCPPLAQSRRKLTELYAQALAAQHPKADKYRLQLLTLPPVTYEWYWTKHGKNTALPRDQQWSDMTIPYIAIADGIAAVRAQGVRHVVLSSLNRDAYRAAWLRGYFPEIAAFYDEVERTGTLLRRYAPARGYAQGPRLELYDIGAGR
ncbi:MAG TPA: phospholipid carrier-dependent glycosyltransferase [bacterium]|nr:phospholipid carrier-dependent glycosyltransferase [bacterium]